MTRSLLRLALLVLTAAAAAVGLQPPAVAAPTGTLTGLSHEYDYQLADAADGCSRKDRAQSWLVAPGEGSVFAETEYDSGWVVTLDVTTPDGDLLASVSTKKAYTSVYEGERELYIELRCKVVRQLLQVGHGAGPELRFAVTSAIFNDGEYTLDTTAATLAFTPKRVATIVPQRAKKTSRGYRITSQVRLWSPVDEGYGWSDPGTGVKVNGYWKGCPSTVTTATDGTFVVHWRRAALFNGRNFGYGVAETKKIGSFFAGWVIEGRRSFRATDEYFNGCGGA